jgi:hypothetical protein
MWGGGVRFSFSLSGEQLLWLQLWAFAAASGGGEQVFTNLHFLTLEHPLPFTLDRTVLGTRLWGHLFEIEKVAGKWAPVA